MKHFDVRELQLRHHALDYAIHELDRRGEHMTPEERSRSHELKKQRLATKDALYALSALSRR